MAYLMFDLYYRPNRTNVVQSVTIFLNIAVLTLSIDWNSQGNFKWGWTHPHYHHSRERKFYNSTHMNVINA